MPLPLSPAAAHATANVAHLWRQFEEKCHSPSSQACQDRSPGYVGPGGAMGNVSAPTNLCHRSGLNLGLP
jgi:hypothetical protein